MILRIGGTVVIVPVPLSETLRCACPTSYDRFYGDVPITGGSALAGGASSACSLCGMSLFDHDTMGA